MSIRLTNHMRSMIAANVEKSLPKSTFDVSAKVEKMKKLVMDDAISKVPPHIKRLWDSNTDRFFIKTASAYYAQMGSMAVPVNTYDAYGYSISSKVRLELDEILKEINASFNTVAQARAHLMSCLNACSTVKSLLSKYPELERFLPDSAKSAPVNTTTALVVQSPLSKFKGLGLSMEAPDGAI